TSSDMVFEDYEDEDVAVAAMIPKTPVDLSHQPESLPEEAPIQATHTNINLAKLKHGDLKNSAQLPAGPVVLENHIEEIDFSFNIHFNEENYLPTTLISYTDKNFDYSSYIDTKDETIKEL